MKLHALFLLLFFSCYILEAHSQPVLTAADLNPQPGEVFIEHRVYLPQLTAFSSASVANATWDLSSINFSSVDTFAYISCNDATACGFFPGANIVRVQNVYDSSYFSSSDSNGMVYLGTIFSGSTVSDTSFVIIPSINHYPLIYGTTYVDSTSEMQKDYAAVPDVFSKVYFKSYNTTSYDGFGNLILPIGTFQNVLRAHIVSNLNFSYAQYSPAASGIDSDVEVHRQHIDNYVWYAKGFHNMLAFVEFVTDSSYSESSYYTPSNYNARSYVSASYFETLPVTTVHSGISEFTCYPNPVGKYLVVLFRVSELRIF